MREAFPWPRRCFIATMPASPARRSISWTTSRAASSGSRTCRTRSPPLARLHSFDPAALGLGDFGRGDNYVARQVERWSKQYRASETDAIAEMERLIAWLPSHLP